MRTKVILGLVAVCIVVGTFVAGVLVERHYPSLLSFAQNPPDPLSPAEGAVLPNGVLNEDKGKGKPIDWEFTWSEVPGAERYQLAVKHPMLEWVEVIVAQPRYRWNIEGWKVVNASQQQGWSWRVRAETRGGWSRWSKVRTFDVDPTKE